MSTWQAESIFDGRGKLWTSPEYDGWQIFEQPAGFYVWRRYAFSGEFETLEAAKLHLLNRKRQYQLERALTAYDSWVSDRLEITPDSDHYRDCQDASDEDGLKLLHRLATAARAMQ